MENMKKIGLIIIVAALGVAGYILVNKHCKMSESGNVKIQMKEDKGAFCSRDSDCRSGDCHKSKCK